MKINIPIAEYKISIKRAFLFTVLLGFLSFQDVLAQELLALDDNLSKQKVHQYLDYYIDSSSSLKIEDFIREGSAIKFKDLASEEDFLRLGVTNAVVWAKFTIKNTTDHFSEYVIQFEDPSLFDVRQYSLDDDGEMVIQYSGTSVKASQKPLYGNDNSFFILLDSQEERTFFYRIQSKNFISLPVSLISYNRYFRESSLQRFGLGIYYGALILIILFGIVVYLSYRKSYFLYYVGSVFFLGLITGSYDGTTAEVFHPLIVLTNGYYETIVSTFSNSFSLLLMISFLDIKRIAPRLHQVSIAVIIIMVVVMLMGFFKPAVSLQTISVFSLPVMGLMISGGIVGVRKKIRFSEYFLSAYLVMTLSVLVAILSLFDILPYNQFIKYVLHVGFLINFIVIAVGLNRKISQMSADLLSQQREKDLMKQQLIEQKNQELEEEVYTRTKDIKEKEINLRAILDNNTNDAIWLVDRSYCLIDFNAYMKVNFEAAYDQQVERGIRILDIIPIEDLRNEWKSRYDQTLEGKPGLYFDEYPVMDEDIHYFQINTYPIKSGDEIVGVSVYARNITNIKLSESELQKRNEELEKLNRELDRFVYSASHDLKAPLSSVLGLINIMKHEDDQGNKMEMLDMMENSIQKLNYFIRDIENYARNTRTEIKMEDFDMEDLINEVLEGLKFIPEFDLVKKKIKFETGKTIKSDRQRIQVIISNLINNAIRYSAPTDDRDEVAAEVAITVTESETDYVISISDNGPGIPKEHQSNIFDMFYRVDEKGNGTGLGLYIVNETVERLNGTITLSSEEGTGTTFTVSIPKST